MSGRIYARKFDWDEAKRLRASGVPVREIAERLGVSSASIYQVTTPGSLARARTTTAEYQSRNWRKYQYRGVCVDCGGKCRTCAKRCRECYEASRSKPDVDDAGRVFCTHCETWLPADVFSFDGRSGHRGFRRLECRACSTKARQEYRQRHKQPCIGCGKPALPPGEKGASGGLEPRCRDCMAAFYRLPEQREAARQRALRALGKAA